MTRPALPLPLTLSRRLAAPKARTAGGKGGVLPRLIVLLIGVLLAIALAPPAHADRVRDLGTFQGVRSNQLTGYGVVVGLPGTGGFIAEFLVFMGTFLTKPWIAAFACLGIVITSIYVLRLLRRVFFGKLNEHFAHMEDARTTEWVALGVTCMVILTIGIWPGPMIAVISSAVQPVVGLLH